MQSASAYTWTGGWNLCAMKPLRPVLRELSKVKTSVEAAEAAFRNATADTGITQPVVKEPWVDVGKWDGKRLPVPSLQGIHKCGVCGIFVYLWTSTGEMTQKQNLVAQMQGEGWNLLKCGGKHTEQVCLFLLVRNSQQR